MRQTVTLLIAGMLAVGCGQQSEHETESAGEAGIPASRA